MEVAFAGEDCFVLINYGTHLRNYSIGSGEWEKDPFSASIKSNDFSSMVVTNDQKTLLVLNNSQLLTLNLFSAEQRSFAIPQSECQGQLYLDPHTSRLLTASYHCHLCSFTLTDGSLTILSQTQLPECRLQQIEILGDRIILVQSSVMSRRPTLLTLDLGTLKVVGQHSLNSTGFPVAIELYRNFILVFSVQDSTVWLFLDNLTTLVSQIELSPLKVIGLVFATLDGHLVTLLQHPTLNSVSAEFLQLSLNCSGDALDCSCGSGEAFQMSSYSCARLPCALSQAERCPCLHS